MKTIEKAFVFFLAQTIAISIIIIWSIKYIYILIINSRVAKISAKRVYYKYRILYLTRQRPLYRCYLCDGFKGHGKEVYDACSHKKPHEHTKDCNHLWCDFTGFPEKKCSRINND